MRSRNAAQLRVVNGLHRRFELALVGLERGEFGVDPTGDVFEVVRGVGLEQQQVLGPMVGDSVLWEEVRVAGGHDALAGEQAGVAMIGMQPISLPRVVAEHHVGPELSDRERHVTACHKIAIEFAVDVLEEHDLARLAPGQSARCLALLALASGRQRNRVGCGIPGALRSIGTHEVMHRAAAGGPFCKGRAAAELDVVGVSPDRQGHLRHREIVGGVDGTAGERRLPRFVGAHTGILSPSTGCSTGTTSG